MPDDDRGPVTALKAPEPEDRNSALDRLLPTGHLVRGELKTHVTVTVTDVTERAAQAHLQVARAIYVEPVRVSMRYGILLPLAVLLVVVFGGAAMKVDSSVLTVAVVAVGAALGIGAWKYLPRLLDRTLPPRPP